MEIEEQETPKKHHISIADRWQIVNLKDQGYSASEISKIIPASKSAINDLYKKYQKNHDVIDLPHTGRPKKTKEEENKMILETTNANLYMSLNQIIEESKVNISKSKCWDVLKCHDYDCRTVAKKWRVDEFHQENRLNWANEYIKKSDLYWKRIVFTDESLVVHDSSKQRLWLLKEAEVPPTQRQ